MFFSSIRKLAIEESGPWYPYRGYTQRQLLKAGIRPGDMVCRLGNAYAFGYIHLSKIIAKITGSNYSHAAMVLDITENDILLADVDTHGLRRQYFVDWIDDARSDRIGVLRFEGDDKFREASVNICKDLIYKDPQFNYDFDDDKRFCCVELICWCYLKAGINLCDEHHINKMPGWKNHYAPFARMNGVDPNHAVWCVGNDAMGLYSSKHLRQLLEVKLPNWASRKINKVIYQGA